MVSPIQLPIPKPRLRGVSHQWAFVAFLGLGIALVIAAPPGRATLAALIYALSVCGLFGSSALYHRGNWAAAAHRWLRRLDHSMIFVLIAGTYTPIALLALEGALSTAILIAVWSGALGGIILQFVWTDAPRWVSFGVYVGLGWVAVAALPALVEGVGWTATVLVMVGGLLYTLGALVYATQRPDPAPATFGYHEIFHAFTIVAAGLQFAVVAFFVLPQAA